MRNLLQKFFSSFADDKILDESDLIEMDRPVLESGSYCVIKPGLNSLKKDSYDYVSPYDYGMGGELTSLDGDVFT